MQLKAITEKLPLDDSDNEILKSLHSQAEDFLDSSNTTSELLSSLHTGSERDQQHTTSQAKKTRKSQDQRPEDQVNPTHEPSHESGNIPPDSDRRSSGSSSKEDEPQPSSEDVPKIQEHSATKSEKGKEVIEQFEPGVYVTLIVLQNGTKVFRRVKFRYFNNNFTYKLQP